MLIMTIHFLRNPAPSCSFRISQAAPAAMPISVEAVVREAAQAYSKLLHMDEGETVRYLRPLISDLPTGQALRSELVAARKINGWPAINTVKGGEIIFTIQWIGDISDLTGESLTRLN